MKRILFTCPYVPAEWIAAHGLQPCQVLPQGPCRADLEGLEGICTFVRAFLSEALTDRHAHAVIMSTLCDQMRRAFDLYRCLDQRPGFLFNVPTTWHRAQARDLYADEVRRLGRFLTALGGTSPDAPTLARTMHACQTRDPKHPLIPHQGRPSDQVRLALVGGPQLPTDRVLLELLESCDGHVVLDATETGLLGTRRAFRQETMQDPFDELVDAYFESIHHIGRRPNTGFYHRLQEALRNHEIQGVIWRRYLWCDLWHAELARFKEMCELPVLDLEIADCQLRDRARMLTRVQAFVEVLK